MPVLPLIIRDRISMRTAQGQIEILARGPIRSRRVTSVSYKNRKHLQECSLAECAVMGGQCITLADI
jgi:hypothetical protein